MDRILDARDNKAEEKRIQAKTSVLKDRGGKEQKPAPGGGEAGTQTSGDDQASLEVVVAAVFAEEICTESTGAEAEIEPQADTETASSPMDDQAAPTLSTPAFQAEGTGDENAGPHVSASDASEQQVERAPASAGAGIHAEEPEAERAEAAPSDSRQVAENVRNEAPVAPHPDARVHVPSGADRVAMESGKSEQVGQAMEPVQELPLPKYLESLRSLEQAARAQAESDGTEATMVSTETGPSIAAARENAVKPSMPLFEDDRVDSARADSELTPSAPRIIEVAPIQGRAGNGAPVSEAPVQVAEQPGLAEGADSKLSQGQARDEGRDLFAERFAADIQESRFVARADFNPAATLVKGPDGDFVPVGGTATAPEIEQSPFEQMLMRAERLQDVIQRFDEHVLDLTSSKGNSMTINLIPPNLGKLVLSCKESGETISIQIVASSNQAREFLANREDVIREILANRGRELSEFDVRTDDNNQGQKQFAGQRASEDDEPTGRLADASEPPVSARGIEHKQEEGRTAEGIWYVA